MKKFLFPICIMSVACLLSACESSIAQKGQPTPTPGTSGEARSVNNSNNGSNIKTFDNSNISLKISNVGPPAEETVESTNAGTDRARSRLRERVDADPRATPPPPTFQAAPENSEFATQMENGGGILETRIFKSHPQLKKVEIRWIDPQTRSLKVTLRNGKIVERPVVRIANLRTVSSTEILNIIGTRAGQK